MVYVDLLVIQNVIYNYVILLGVSILLTRITNLKKIFFSSVIGTVPLIFLFINISSKITFLISFLFSIIMSLLAFEYKDIKYTLKNIFYMYTTSIFIAGSIYLINTNVLPQINNHLLNTIILTLISPIITFIYIKSINNYKYNYSNYYKVDIYLKENKIKTITAFLDTGNKLIDPYKQRPIILVNKSLINIEKEKVILVPYNTVNNSDLLKCIIPEKIYIEKIGTRKNLLIGIMDEVNIEGADCILNTKLLERI